MDASIRQIDFSIKAGSMTLSIMKLSLTALDIVMPSVQNNLSRVSVVILGVVAPR